MFMGSTREADRGKCRELTKGNLQLDKHNAKLCIANRCDKALAQQQLGKAAL